MCPMVSDAKLAAQISTSACGMMLFIASLESCMPEASVHKARTAERFQTSPTHSMHMRNSIIVCCNNTACICC